MTDSAYTTLISSAELLRRLGDPAWVILDCRFALKDPASGRKHYLEGHIPGAHYADLDKDMSSPATPESGRHPLPDPEELAGKLRAWGVGGDSQVVVYDDTSGTTAGRMWWLLRYLGHERVAVLDGGFGKWLGENGPLEEGTAAPAAAGDFSAAPNDALWVETAEIEHARGRDDTVVIDARAPVRYRGEKEEVDSDAGHIPGSVNHPLQNNLDEDGCFRAAAELRGIYDRLRKPRTIHSCGSGVTACHNLLAMEIAGFPGSLLYVGSWSEWIRSPQRPRAAGKDPG